MLYRGMSHSPHPRPNQSPVSAWSRVASSRRATASPARHPLLSQWHRPNPRHHHLSPCPRRIHNLKWACGTLSPPSQPPTTKLSPSPLPRSCRGNGLGAGGGEVDVAEAKTTVAQGWEDDEKFAPGGGSLGGPLFGARPVNAGTWPLEQAKGLSGGPWGLVRVTSTGKSSRVDAS